MELKMSLKPYFKKSKKKVLFGVLILCSAVGYCLFLFFYESSSDWSDFGLAFTPILMSVFLISDGSGKPLFIRRSYVHITNEFLKIKTIDVENNFLWSEIDSIQINETNLRFGLNSSRQRIVELKFLEVYALNKIIDSIRTISGEKHIPVETM